MEKLWLWKSQGAGEWGWGDVDASGTGWGITSGCNPEMALLAEHLLKPPTPPPGQADQDRALSGGSVPPAAFLPLPRVPSVCSHQGRHK